MMDGAVRRHVDARLVSYALSIVREKEATPELQSTLHQCAALALQAASGVFALGLACKAAAKSPVLTRGLNSRQLAHVRALFEGMSASIEDSWKNDLKELFEVVIVLAADTSGMEDMVRLRQWGQGVFLDTRPLAIMDEAVVADVERDQAPAAKRHRVRKPRSSKQSYQSERLENLVSRAIARGVACMHPVLTGGHILVVGTGDGKEHKLLKLRGSMAEANDLCEQANLEISNMNAVEQAM